MTNSKDEAWVVDGGEGIWTRWRNTITGETSYREHTPIPASSWCAINRHNFVIVDMKKRIAECTYCQQETTFIVGVDTIKGDKVTIE